MAKRKVGFVGTGIMGLQMARRLAEAGHEVTAWNRTREKARPLAGYGAAVVGRPSEVADGAEFVVCMLSDGPTSDAVLFDEDAVARAMPRGSVLVVMSSIPVETARLQGERALALGLDYLDAPVSGGERGATDGTLAIMVGGDPAVYERAAELFGVLGRPTRIGPVGTGQLAKLANQVIVANTLATVAEAFVLAAAGGADPARVREALLGGFADSTVLRQHGERMVRREFEPGGPARYQLKDQRTATALARSLGVELPVTELVQRLYEDMVARGHGDRDHSAIFLELAERSGIAAPL